MADKKISEMTVASAYTGANEFYELVQGGATRQGSHALLKTYFDTLYVLVAQVTSPVAWTPTFTGFGTVSGVTAYSWRVGSELFFEIRFLSGIPSSTEARISLGFNGTNGNVTSASNYPALQQIGAGGSGNQVGRTYTIIMEPSVTYLTIGMDDASNGALVKRNGDGLLANGWSFACKGSVRINGW